jgi:hypothetical protein
MKKCYGRPHRPGKAGRLQELSVAVPCGLSLEDAVK